LTRSPAPLVAALALLLGVALHHCRAPEGRELRALRALDCVREDQGPGAADRCLEALRWADSLRAGLGQ
jgi:hypothetical protein